MVSYILEGKELVGQVRVNLRETRLGGLVLEQSDITGVSM